MTPCVAVSCRATSSPAPAPRRAAGKPAASDDWGTLHILTCLQWLDRTMMGVLTWLSVSGGLTGDDDWDDAPKSKAAAAPAPAAAKKAVVKKLAAADEDDWDNW